MLAARAAENIVEIIAELCQPRRFRLQILPDNISVPNQFMVLVLAACFSKARPPTTACIAGFPLAKLALP